MMFLTGNAVSRRKVHLALDSKNEHATSARMNMLICETPDHARRDKRKLFEDAWVELPRAGGSVAGITLSRRAKVG